MRQIRYPSGQVVEGIPNDFNAVLQVLNQLGSEGWEVIASMSGTEQHPQSSFYLKRATS
jgi:hypothetical protein